MIPNHSHLFGLVCQHKGASRTSTKSADEFLARRLSYLFETTVELRNYVHRLHSRGSQKLADFGYLQYLRFINFQNNSTSLLFSSGDAPFTTTDNHAHDCTSMNGMLEYKIPGYAGYAVKYSPFFDSRIAVAAR
jgi:hypothetical protein